jgi:transposase
VRDRHGRAQAQAWRLGHRHRPGRDGKKGLIERAYTLGSRLGLAVWCADEAGPFQATPHPGSSWRLHGQPDTQPHEYVRGGTSKILTLFHPATGRVHLRPVTSCTNPVLHGWLKEALTTILTTLPASTEPDDAAATRVVWEVWQDGLTECFTLPERLPPLRMLLVWDNLAGHKTAEMVVWLYQHGVMPLYTPLGGSWLNMAESIQRILKRRALSGQHPRSPTEIGAWFEQTAQAWNRQPTPFVWHGKRRQRRRKRRGDTHAVGGSAAHTRQPLSARQIRRHEWHTPSQVTH